MKNQFRIIRIIMLMIFFTSLQQNTFAQWTQVDVNLGFVSNGSTPSIAFNPSTNEPYVAYADGAANAFVIRKYTGTAWTQVGVNLGFASNGSTPSIAFNPSTSDAYVAYADGAANAFSIQKTTSTTGIINNNSVSTLLIYPNPASEFITVKANSNTLGLTYIIADHTGRQVLTGKLNKEMTSVDISQLAKGVYVFQIGELSKHTFKIVKN